MDDFTAELLSSGSNDTSRQESQTHDDMPSDGEAATPSGGRTGLRARVAKMREKASIQDRLLEKLLEQVIPTDEGAYDSVELSAPPDKTTPRPNFNITTMSNNFRRFNARIGVVFNFQDSVERLLGWKTYSHTLSFLAVYTFVCLDPNLLCMLPPAVLLLGVFIPSFLARHPAPPAGTQSSDQPVGYSARGPPLAPARTVRPARDFSRDFFHNMRDLQNSMGDFCTAHDQVVALIVPATNFSNETLSSALFLFLAVACVLLSISAHLLPWRYLLLAGGWGAVGMGHPAVARFVVATHRTHVVPQEERAKAGIKAWIDRDVILDSAPETREVEIFELQRMAGGPGGEWEPWLFSPSPYDPLSQNRITGERPRGTRFFEDVLAPDGWEWSEKKWALDLWSREWVEERIITGVEVETEGERWVYDIYDENEARTGVVDAESERGKARTASTGAAAQPPRPSWEEGHDGLGRRGEWRRRRWVRLVKRRNIGS